MELNVGNLLIEEMFPERIWKVRNVLIEEITRRKLYLLVSINTSKVQHFWQWECDPVFINVTREHKEGDIFIERNNKVNVWQLIWADISDSTGEIVYLLKNSVGDEMDTKREVFSDYQLYKTFEVKV